MLIQPGSQGFSLTVRSHTRDFHGPSLGHPAPVEKVMPVLVRDAAIHEGKP
jgi:hypothetical protein